MKKTILLFLMFSLLLSACNTSQSSDSFKLYYYKDSNKDAIVSKNSVFPSGSHNEAVQNLFSALSASSEKQYTPIIPSDISLTDVKISNNTCYLYLSNNYLNLNVVEKNAINACLSKTICQLPYVESIVINCKDYSETFIGDDFLIDVPNLQYDTYTVNLYFANEDFSDLACESQTISLRKNESLESIVFEHLISGPTKVGMQKAIPDGTTLNSIYVDDGICYIDVSSEFVENTKHDELHEKIVVYSIVNTITELPMINSVRFYVDGNLGYGYTYHKISSPLTYNIEFHS